MKQATALALCVLPLAIARKSVANGPDITLALAATKKVTSACSSHVCSSGYQPKENYENITGNATDANCCNPTCRRWNCGSGWKAHPQYAANVGASNEECCDKTCALFTSCRAGTGVAASKRNDAGTTQDACCSPTCKYHSCIGNWAQDLSKINNVSNTDEDCCQKSCLTVDCKSELGLVHHPDRTDKPGTTTDFCCQKMCSYYANQCPANTGTLKEKMQKRVLSTSTSGALGECCDAKCSGHTCSAGYVLAPLKSDEFVSKAFPGCCEKTCKAHTCSAGYVKISANDNQTQPSDKTCCAPTCKFWACPAGWFNSTNSAKLNMVNRSNDNCCEHSCRGFSCSAGMTLRPSPESIEKTGADVNSVCCESAVCKELREDRTPTSVQVGTSTAGLDCNDFSGPDQNCSSKYKLFNISGALTAVPCIMSNMSLCKMDDTRVVTACSDLGLD